MWDKVLLSTESSLIFFASCLHGDVQVCPTTYAAGNQVFAPRERFHPHWWHGNAFYVGPQILRHSLRRADSTGNWTEKFQGIPAVIVLGKALFYICHSWILILPPLSPETDAKLIT